MQHQKQEDEDLLTFTYNKDPFAFHNDETCVLFYCGL